jgi:hypothetical protein
MEHSEKELKERLATAELVVKGRITAIRKSTVRPKGLTEHDPDWHEADVKVEKILKGAPAESVTFLFARSSDVMWYRAPKFAVGNEGIWLLQPFEFAGSKLKLPAVVDARDSLKRADEPRVVRALR